MSQATAVSRGRDGGYRWSQFQAEAPNIFLSRANGYFDQSKWLLFQ